MESSDLSPLSEASQAATPAEAPIYPRRVEVIVQKPDGTQASCGKKWVITALKVLLVVVVIAGFIAASVFTFGAAGLFGGAAASALGVTVASSTAATGALYVAGGVLVTATGGMIRLAYKHKMGEYTGTDRGDAQRFLVESVQGVVKIVKEALSKHIKDYFNVPDQSELKVRQEVWREVISAQLGDVPAPLPEDAKKFLRTAFEKLQKEESSILSEETRKVIDDVIQELKEKGRKNLSQEAHDFISQAIGMRAWQQILPQSVKKVIRDPEKVSKILKATVAG